MASGEKKIQNTNALEKQAKNHKINYHKEDNQTLILQQSDNAEMILINNNKLKALQDRKCFIASFSTVCIPTF